MSDERMLLLGKRIMVVEDDIMNMAITAVALRQSGAVVIQDPWNSATLDLIRLHRPQAILLDLMLRRGVSGYDIFDEIKADPRLAGIPVIAVSASDPSVEIPKAQAKGFSGFISKPVSLHHFAGQIARCLSGDAVWDGGLDNTLSSFTRRPV